jgi:hypothetical protein
VGSATAVLTVDAAGGPQAPAPVIRFHNIFSQCPRPVDTAPPRGLRSRRPPQLARNIRTYEIALSVASPSPSGVLPAGTIVRRTSSDPGRALVTGFVGGAGPLDDWEKFDVPGLRGISRTAPYFINNSAATLEAMVDHYIELFKRVEANFVPGNVVPPIATTDGVHFDRRPPGERARPGIPAEALGDHMAWGSDQGRCRISAGSGRRPRGVRLVSRRSCSSSHGWRTASAAGGFRSPDRRARSPSFQALAGRLARAAAQKMGAANGHLRHRHRDAIGRTP